MAKKPLLSVVLDTSFLITLCDNRRPHHEVAKQYFKYWVEHRTIMFLPAIAYTEYLSKAEKIPDVVLRYLKVKSFNAEDAEIAAKIQRERIVIRDGEGVQRDAFKDDIKIIGSACTLCASAIAHDDSNSMHKFIHAAAEKFTVAAELKSICLDAGYNDGLAALSDPTLL